jgi:deoxyribodipyrimidine photo-lyase
MAPAPAVAIALFTRDLRVHDNPVLVAASRHEHVVPLFVLDDGCRPFVSANRAALLVDSLEDLSSALRARGGALVVRRGKVVHEVCALARQTGATQVHVAADVSRYAQRREHALAAALRAEGCELVVHEGVVTVVPPGAVTPQTKDHYAVFTPYFRRWLQQPRRPLLDPPRRFTLPRLHAGAIPRAADLCQGATSDRLMRGGERAGRARLTSWSRKVDAYSERRDALSGDGTSRLSAYLHFGCVSPVEVIHRIGHDSAGRRDFVRQLAWRDFHHQLLAARPECSWADYRPRGDQWRDDHAAFEAWRAGRTGIPVIDAAMRQLRTEGWLHNRARLLVGSFLTKTLYIDWRWGARHFLDWLVDADIANNQLNWQWVAGTGADTRPNRVLNPVVQALRHDPDGRFVRRHLSELAGIAGPAVHQPWKLPPDVRRSLDYPDPIVDIDTAGRGFRAARAGR